ncbi:hypothetical protein QO004_005133 [Rhizobium mesoamericanum]|uniref:hypothetical protein n=1 Tax=Rhizobium mesoamericanum TaxID=1079800 RepID=UPI00277EB793|nr:hypothetical protein [Rhizobium mesoamericanum]MDQ0563324.1 hypothetical protein [Rhizobium mesoamericanum]
MQRNKVRFCTFAIAMAAAGTARTSSGDAWQEFATEVDSKCKQAAGASIESPHTVVDPFGSEHFGIALVTGKPKGVNGFVSYFCVYDKQTKEVELGSEIKTEEMRILPDE